MGKLSADALRLLKFIEDSKFQRAEVLNPNSCDKTVLIHGPAAYNNSVPEELRQPGLVEDLWKADKLEKIGPRLYCAKPKTPED